jgi:flagellar basal-body rod protein FlgB
MNFVGIDLDGILSPYGSTLDLINHKQGIVSHNLANANTPGYSAKSVAFSDLMAMENSPFETGLSKKMGHLKPEEMVEGTGHPVNIHEEMIEMQRNNLYFSMATRRLSSVITALKSSAQIGR